MPTLAELLTRKAAYIAAEAKILESQQYTVGDGVTNRSNRRADLEQVRLQIKQLDEQIAAHPDSNTAASPRRLLYIR